MDGAVVLVTGATSGLGLATAIGVARRGATVRFTARSRDRALQAKAAITDAAPGSDVDFLLADMSRLDDVRALADQFIAHHDHLDVLVHNAGALTGRYTVTDEGTEVTVATQLVAPFLLTGLLLERLRAAIPSRVIQVSSEGCTPRGSTSPPSRWARTSTTAPWPMPRSSGLSWCSCTSGSPPRRHGRGVQCHASRLGPYPRDPQWAAGLRQGMGPILRTPDQGADTAVWLASAPEAATATGRFWLDRRPRGSTRSRGPPEWGRLRRGRADLWAWCAARCHWDGIDRRLTPSR